MPEIFLSASVPVEGRGRYHESADPYLIQLAVRELITASITDAVLVWGGHPAITPMIWTICSDLGVDYGESVVLYQSLFFQTEFPRENKDFPNTIFVPAVNGDREKSLTEMRGQMLSRKGLRGAVFVGGMEGLFEEYRLFRTIHPRTPVLVLGATGGAVLDLPRSDGDDWMQRYDGVNFARVIRTEFLPRLG